MLDGGLGWCRLARLAGRGAGHQARGMGGSGQGTSEFFARMRDLKAFRDSALGGIPSDRAPAKMLGMSPTTIGEWLKGSRFPQAPRKVTSLVRHRRGQRRPPCRPGGRTACAVSAPA